MSPLKFYCVVIDTTDVLDLKGSQSEILFLWPQMIPPKSSTIFPAKFLELCTVNPYVFYELIFFYSLTCVPLFPAKQDYMLFLNLDKFVFGP